MLTYFDGEILLKRPFFSTTLYKVGKFAGSIHNAFQVRLYPLKQKYKNPKAPVTLRKYLCNWYKNIIHSSLAMTVYAIARHCDRSSVLTNVKNMLLKLAKNLGLFSILNNENL